MIGIICAANKKFWLKLRQRNQLQQFPAQPNSFLTSKLTQTVIGWKILFHLISLENEIQSVHSVRM